MDYTQLKPNDNVEGVFNKDDFFYFHGVVKLVNPTSVEVKCTSAVTSRGMKMDAPVGITLVVPPGDIVRVISPKTDLQIAVELMHVMFDKKPDARRNLHNISYKVSQDHMNAEQAFKFCADPQIALLGENVPNERYDAILGIAYKMFAHAMSKITLAQFVTWGFETCLTIGVECLKAELVEIEP